MEQAKRAEEAGHAQENRRDERGPYPTVERRR